jgi:predicted nucleic-acid-binding Zn-ribbon protein
MRTTATCPKCSGKKILVAELRDDTGDFPHRARPVPVVAWNVGPISTIGRFESWICAACGYTEFYAKDLGDVDELAAQLPNDVRIVDSASPKKGPFR